MSHAATEEFQVALESIEEAYRQGMRAFVTWMEAHWQHEGADRWATLYQDAYPGDAHRDGWNACIAGLSAALDVFLDEQNG
jgi:hypothetical protein